MTGYGPLRGLSQKNPTPRSAQSLLFVHCLTPQLGGVPQRTAPSALSRQRQSSLALQ
jgi:hypothetical protein